MNQAQELDVVVYEGEASSLQIDNKSLPHEKFCCKNGVRSGLDTVIINKPTTDKLLSFS